MLSHANINVRRVRGGPWGQNCFLVTHDGRALVIDPGGNADEILSVLDARNLALVAILNTHGHFDHIGAVQQLVDVTGAAFYISGKEVPIMKTSNMLRFIFKSKEKVVVPRSFVDLDSSPSDLVFGAMMVRRIETPGHTPGGQCFVIGNHLFSGDTVLRSMPGTAELPGGNAEDLARSLKLLGTLPSGLILHPGHGADTTLGETLELICDRSSRTFGESE